MAEASDVEIRTYEIIYKLLEDIEAAMLGMLAPEFEEVVTGEAEVRQVFRIPRVGAVAGCYVRDGTITRARRSGSSARASHLEGHDHLAAPVQGRRPRGAVGFECGIGLSDFQDLKEGDIIETFEEREIPRTEDRSVPAASTASATAHATPAPCGSTRSCARWWPRSSSGWPTPTSGSAW